MEANDTLALSLKARYPLIVLSTHEETRALDVLKALTSTLVVWSATKGLVAVKKQSPRLSLPQNSTKPTEALSMIEKLDEEMVVVMCDAHPYLKDPVVVRAVRDCVQAFRSGGKTRSLVLMGPSFTLPSELEKVGAIIDLPLPTRAQVSSILAPTRQAVSESVIDSSLGLTEEEIENAASKSIVLSKRLDPKVMQDEKRQIIKKSGILEYLDTEEALDSVGGLDVLKGWLRKRRSAFSDKAREFNLPSPKGILVLGPPGTGKSLVAKATGNSWGFPLIRFDIGRVFAGLVGSSEENMRKALAVIEAVAPCVVFVDELEKALAGSGSSGASDGGTTARVFGTFLTWMQEKKAPVFVVATANDVSALPPELLRKGRFDELFFVDLPHEKEREEIFSILLRKFRRDPKGFDVRALSEASRDYTGAEIEQVIVSALFDAFDEGVELHERHLIRAIGDVVPLSSTMTEKITQLRSWAANRTRPATSPFVPPNPRFN